MIPSVLSFRLLAGLLIVGTACGAVARADVQDAWFDHLNLQRGTGDAPLFDLRGVTDFAVEDSRGINDTRVPGPVVRQKR